MNLDAIEPKISSKSDNSMAFLMFRDLKIANLAFKAIALKADRLHNQYPNFRNQPLALGTGNREQVTGDR